jgi:hypothetical protein
MEEAWAAYLRGLEEVRQSIFNHRFAEGERERNEAYYLFQQVQAEAFQVAVAPRPDYPRFYSLFDPMTFTWGIPNPDFIYTRTYLDGRRTYRIRGRRGNSLFVVIQALNAHLTLPADRLKLLGEYDLDALKIADDGSFELIASATVHEGTGSRSTRRQTEILFWFARLSWIGAASNVPRCRWRSWMISSRGP